MSTYLQLLVANTADISIEVLDLTETVVSEYQVKIKIE